ncbi:hypothetical protein AVEN_243598-1 [Araneus ventricosus]|uniref:Uncharacterized protein n=1 Tax=Araneus ventricosus TaxID=182803 RepID=A0A4Y2A722_ARAVE|nr:hypothetical protein AVEN_243598-1 [Araneus ventricosus]
MNAMASIISTFYPAGEDSICLCSGFWKNFSSFNYHNKHGLFKSKCGYHGWIFDSLSLKEWKYVACP